MPWKKLLVWATGRIDETLRQELELVLEESRLYRALLDRHSPHWRLQDAERKPVVEKGKPLCTATGFELIWFVERLHFAMRINFRSNRNAEMVRAAKTE